VAERVTVRDSRLGVAAGCPQFATRQRTGTTASNSRAKALSAPKQWLTTVEADLHRGRWEEASKAQDTTFSEYAQAWIARRSGTKLRATTEAKSAGSSIATTVGDPRGA